MTHRSPPHPLTPHNSTSSQDRSYATVPRWDLLKPAGIVSVACPSQKRPGTGTKTGYTHTTVGNSVCSYEVPVPGISSSTRGGRLGHASLSEETHTRPCAAFARVSCSTPRYGYVTTVGLHNPLSFGRRTTLPSPLVCFSFFSAQKLSRK